MITVHDKFYHSGIVKKSIIIHAQQDIVWNKISDITHLTPPFQINLWYLVLVRKRKKNKESKQLV